MRIRHLRQTPLPNTGDATKVQPSDWNSDHVCDVDILSENATFIVDPSGQSGQFSTFNECISHVNSLIAPAPVSISIQLTAGIFGCSQETIDVCAHSNVQIVGQCLQNLGIASCTVSGNAPSRLVTYVMSTTIPASVTAGMVLIFHNSRLADAVNAGHYGAHVITEVNAGNNSITVLNKNTAAVPPIVSAKTACVDVVCSVLKATAISPSVLSCMGTRHGTYADPFLKNIAIDGALLTTYGFRARKSSSVSVGGVFAVVNTGIGILAEDSSHVMLNSLSTVVSSSSTGILSSRASLVDANNGAIITGCGVGAGATECSNLIVRQSHCIDNATSIQATNLSRVSYGSTQERSYVSVTSVDDGSVIG